MAVQRIHRAAGTELRAFGLGGMLDPSPRLAVRSRLRLTLLAAGLVPRGLLAGGFAACDSAGLVGSSLLASGSGLVGLVGVSALMCCSLR